MYHYFSERYKDILTADDFTPNFSTEQKRCVVHVMQRFAAPMQLQLSRYDFYTVGTDALLEAIEIFGKHQGWGTFDANCDLEEILCKRDAHELFDIIEIQHEQIGGKEASEYQIEINIALDEIDCPFRLANGRIIKLDAKQFEHDLKRKALCRLEQLRCDEPLFQSAHGELIEAFEKYKLGDYDDCILKAECSFESMMKILLNNKESADAPAGRLIKQFVSSDYCSKMSEDAKRTMENSVLQSLPAMRNKSGSGHGQGTKIVNIPKSMANLALNLASALNTFLADLYLEKLSSQKQKEEQADSLDIPF